MPAPWKLILFVLAFVLFIVDAFIGYRNPQPGPMWRFQSLGLAAWVLGMMLPG